MPAGAQLCRGKPSAHQGSPGLRSALANPISNPTGSSLPWDRAVQAMPSGWQGKEHRAVPLQVPCPLVTPVPLPKSAVAPRAEPGASVLPVVITPNVGAAGSQLKSNSLCLGE